MNEQVLSAIGAVLVVAVGLVVKYWATIKDYLQVRSGWSSLPPSSDDWPEHSDQPHPEAFKKYLKEIHESCLDSVGDSLECWSDTDTFVAAILKDGASIESMQRETIKLLSEAKGQS